MRPAQFVLRSILCVVAILASTPAAIFGQTVSKAALGFGNQVVGETSAAKNVAFKNTLLVPVTLQSITVTGVHASDFAATPGCALPAVVAAGRSCAVSVRFTPGALGARAASLVFAHNQAGSPLTASLTGTGIVPVTVSPSSLSFGNVVLGTTSPSKTVTLENVQAAQLSIASLVVSAPFVRQGGSCPAGAGVLAGGASCTIGVAFAPLVAGNAAGALTVTHNANNSPQSVAFTGKGVAPITSSAANLSFSPRRVGTTSTPKNVTISNKSGGVLPLGAVTASGDFAVSSSTCGASLAAGAQCVVGVTFTPADVGARLGTLSIPHGEFGPPLQVALSGTGSVGLVSLAVTPSNVTIGLGKTQQFTATATYTDGSSADVTGNAEWLIGIPVRGRLSTAGHYVALASGANTVSATLGLVEGATTVSGARPVFSYKRTTATLLLDGRVLIAGGTDGSFNPTATAELFDPATGTFTATAPMSVPRYGHSATRLQDGRVLVAGGMQGVSGSTSAEIFDPTAGTWTPTGTLVAGRGFHGAVLVGSKVLLAAGYNGNLPLASAELFDPATGTFSPTGSLAQARWGHTTTRLSDGRVLVVGGTTVGAFVPGAPLNSAEIYQPAAGTWSAAASMAVARVEHSATLLQSGDVLVASGANGELFNPASGTWSLTGPVPAGGSSPEAALFPDGTVLLAGSGTSTAVFEPLTAAFAPGPPLAYYRSDHASVRLDDGSVLLIGGYGLMGHGRTAAESAELRTGPVVMTGLTVSPLETEVTHPASVSFVATGTFSDGSVADVTAVVSWSATPSSVAIPPPPPPPPPPGQTSPPGVFDTVGPGTATIRAWLGSFQFESTLVVH